MRGTNITQEALSTTAHLDTFVPADRPLRVVRQLLEQARARELLIDEHFSVDGTLIQAWASQKSFRPKDDAGPKGPGRNAEHNFHG